MPPGDPKSMSLDPSYHKEQEYVWFTMVSYLVQLSHIIPPYLSKGSYCHTPALASSAFDKSLPSSSYWFYFTNLFLKQLTKMENII